MSRRLKRQLGTAQGGREIKLSPSRGARNQSPQNRRLNRWLLAVGGGLAIGAVVVALLAPRFNPVLLGVNLVAIAVGLLMGKVIGLFIFRRVLPTARR